MKNILKNAFKNYLKEEYIYKKNQKLKVNFESSETISRNYSQVFQDIFVLMMLNGKRNGSYVEVGSSDPIRINNTYLLENKFDWVGLSYEIDLDMNNKFNSKRVNKSLCIDATKTDFEKDFAKHKLPHLIDYLQIDIEPVENSYKCLKQIPFEKYNFNIITFETEYYVKGDEYEKKVENFLVEKGYKLVCSRIGRLGNYYEDWYVNTALFEVFKENFEIEKYFEEDPKNIIYENFRRNYLFSIFNILKYVLQPRRDIYS